jgi:hypothetical protein
MEADRGEDRAGLYFKPGENVPTTEQTNTNGPNVDP